METTEELTAFLTQITNDGYRGRLQARGEARAIIRHDGVLPPDSPAFGDSLDVDLAEYGFSLLRAALALREVNGDGGLIRLGFVRAGHAFEALVQNGSPADSNRGFYRVIGSAAFHLARYSALAFSLLSQSGPNQNLSPIEDAMRLLIIRDLTALGERAKTWLQDPTHGDAAIARAGEAGEIDYDDVIQLVVTSAVFRAYAFFEFALQTGIASLVDEARSLLRRAITLTQHSNAISLWWISRIALNLIDDLWANSLHAVLPHDGPRGSENYSSLRKLFIGELYCRKAAEVELWPSQSEAALRAVDITDDLVVALPTSAGKTRIAEIAALMALACGTRVLIVTPLRALSAQTERSFRKTFSTLGFTVSSLYGASGLGGGDEDALRTQDIVISTPEKLDFALRNDPTIINDVGLVVLDEGHLIGPNEREIRYESLVQRLLRRGDNANRRLVCLSAILPEGDQLNDLTAWIRSDMAGHPIQSSWRPTRQRFGMLSWAGNSAKLSFNLEVDGPYIQHFIPSSRPIGRRRVSFPRDNKELTLAAAWKFSHQGKRTLIFCTQRDHVEGYGKTIVDLNRQGYLPTLLEDDELIKRAVAVGQEWLGANHPAVLCLPIGVAIHHGRLPRPFLREVEALLSSSVLRVTVGSPTLAQGLNLNAAVLLIPNLYRAGKQISGEEFANVAGRAGRAFVDLEGLIIHVMHDSVTWRQGVWRQIVMASKARSLSSGIISIVDEVIRRLHRTGIFARADALDYLSNAQEAWFPAQIPDDTDSIESLIERLDATVLGLIAALDANSADLPRLLDEALTGSLWSKQIARLDPVRRQGQMWILVTRATLIWNKTNFAQRRSQFAMGVGLEAGLAIDAKAQELIVTLDLADAAAQQGNANGLSNALVGLAENLLPIRPFTPDDTLPDNWRELLRWWIHGVDVAEIGLDNMRIIDDTFAYRLVWAIEALRMYRRSHQIESAVIEGSAAACLETGLPRNNMAMLVRTGLPSRVAAKIVVEQLQPQFTNRTEMNQWLGSAEITALSNQQNWPTQETNEIWRQFCNETLTASITRWSSQRWEMNLPGNVNIDPTIPGRINIDPINGQVSITSPDYRPLISIHQRLRHTQPSLLQVEFSADRTNACISRMGRGSAVWRNAQ
ncbi:DEAD/DEAH box helicase [Glaciimonas soli]|uniref:DEAD/DEAH box helicase n=1 Tax=Glaciimonas soli TaxID=2590999 RepID=A0A843YT42_9BURK|nr:DEAD/DEAH box helicase [Glaciimonas soli]MQR00668.1 DEAD/DEAH box helicase [Glaciimonas soli]